MPMQDVRKMAEPYTCIYCEQDIWIYNFNRRVPFYVFSEDEYDVLCDDCAIEQGYCPECGRYVGSKHPGLQHLGMCAECAKDTRIDEGEDTTCY